MIDCIISLEYNEAQCESEIVGVFLIYISEYNPVYIIFVQFLNSERTKKNVKIFRRIKIGIHTLYSL